MCYSDSDATAAVGSQLRRGAAKVARETAAKFESQQKYGLPDESFESLTKPLRDKKFVAISRHGQLQIRLHLLSYFCEVT